MKNTTQITFTQATDNKKAVVSSKYVAYAVYTQNKPIWEALGGTRVEGEKFRIEFPTVAKAKAFITQAVTGVSKTEYNKARKTEPKAKVEKNATPAKAKGKAKAQEEFITLTDALGNTFQIPASLITPVKAPAKAKGDTITVTKGNGKKVSVDVSDVKSSTKKVSIDKPTKAPAKAKGNTKTLEPQAQKMLERMKMSVLNRAASAYSIANGGEPTNFDTLGKSAKDLAKYMAKAKADLLKSGKWASAKKMGITKEMLG